MPSTGFCGVIHAVLYPEDLAQKTLCSQLFGPRHNLKKMKKGERMSSGKFCYHF